ncbi:hypothetical protein MVEN_01995500 [Mycena venus]|uniref:Uncharacterized protein n=1 Tax=Mycena venus TaxID=2733690 RepID=A0A8H6XDM8_9AGAR|nr:hypothetical protein MVEN_01995500 [Mycena venus]
MFSRCNYHDEKAPESNLAPHALSTPSPLVHCPPSAYLLPTHCLHLESLLDSALATLALIHDTAPATAVSIFTPHMTEVLRALCRHAALPSLPPTSPPTPATVAPISPPKTTATYADRVEAPKPHSDVKPNLSSGKKPNTPAPAAPLPPMTPASVPLPSAFTPPLLTPSPSPALPPLRSTPQPRYTRPHIVFRFDKGVPDPPAGRLPPAALFPAVQESLVSAGIVIDSIRWSQKGKAAYDKFVET